MTKLPAVNRETTGGQSPAPGGFDGAGTYSRLLLQPAPVPLTSGAPDADTQGAGDTLMPAARLPKCRQYPFYGDGRANGRGSPVQLRGRVTNEWIDWPETP